MKKVISFLPYLILCLTALSCSHTNNSTRDSDYVVIEGEYKIKNVLPLIDLAKGKARIKGHIFDKHEKQFIQGIVKVIGQQIQTIANKDGYFEIILDEGEYMLEARWVGCTTIMTEHIKVKSQTDTEIDFNLGTTIIYCY